MHLLHSVAMWPNLELKTQPKQLLGSLPLDISLPAAINSWHFINAHLSQVNLREVGLHLVKVEVLAMLT
jgi:hypothetical protein